MELQPVTLHTTLVDLGLPSTIADLKNPTEDYILTLITHFLERFLIDVGTIRKPTFEQLNLSLAQDNPEIISLVNLSKVTASICARIFVKNFNLMDIMSPVPKKSRRFAQLMANFVLYATNKQLEINERLEELRLKKQRLDELRNQRMVLLEAKNEQALRISKKLAAKDQLDAEIARLKTRKKERKATQDELQERLKTAQREKNEADQRHANLSAKAIKTGKEMEDIESKYVKSPDRHNSLLRDVIEQKQRRNEKREVLLESLRTKKPSIEHFQNSLSIVSQMDAKLLEVSESHKSFAEITKLMEEREKKKAELNSLIKQESTAGTEKVTAVDNAALEEATTQCNERLSAFRTEKKELLVKKKILEKKLEDLSTQVQEILSQKDDIRGAIIKKESDTNKYLSECQDLYDSEMKQEMDYRNSVTRMLENRR